MVAPDPAIDGLPYKASDITISWRWEHPDLPEEASMLTTPIVLARTPDGWVGPRPGLSWNA